MSKATQSIIVGLSLIGRFGALVVASSALSLGYAGRMSALLGSDRPLQKFAYSEIHMGIRVDLVFYASTQEAAERAGKAVFARFEELEQKMSDYRPDSELMQLCDQAGMGPVRVSPELFLVLSQAQEVSRVSNGAFDVTCGPLVKLWRQARKDLKLPSDLAIREALKVVGWKKIKLDARSRTIELAVPGMKLDLGGIAKGYACDEAIRLLRKEGVNRAMVQAGGDIAVSAPPPGKRGWEISILNTPGEPLLLKNCAVSTSGDAYQFVEIGGKRYSHICDPRTGVGVTNRIQATVIAIDGLTSDPLTKVICVDGSIKARRLLEHFGATSSTVMDSS